jgi:hypothetical protein
MREHFIDGVHECVYVDCFLRRLRATNIALLTVPLPTLKAIIMCAWYDSYCVL